MDIQTYKSIQILALQAVEKPDYDAIYRRVCRYYSEKFATPLHQVEELTEHHVWTHYFESVWGELFSNRENEDVAKQYEAIRNQVLHDETTTETELEDEEWVQEMLNEITSATQEVAVKTLSEAEKMLKDDIWGADKFVEGEDFPAWEEDET